jgi:ribosome maturation factor RimP
LPTFLFYNAEKGMKSHEKFFAEAAGIICGIAEHEGLELVDVEYQREPGGWVLRVLIDRQPGGVTIDDCTDISRQISDVLEVKDIIAFPYRLEVSSPGLNRPLKKLLDFELRIGETVNIALHEPLDGRKHFKGKLTGAHENAIEMLIDGKGFAVPLAAVKKAHVEYDFSRHKQPKKKL